VIPEQNTVMEGQLTVMERQNTVLLEQLEVILEQNDLIKWQKLPFSSRTGLKVIKRDKFRVNA
jgi:hypothetical protein